MIPQPHSLPSSRSSTGALYLTVWRWHFYAGILVAPFVMFLAITGSIYLWKPQYEAWRYRELFTVPANPNAIAAEIQLKAAQAAVPAGSQVLTFQPAFARGQTTQIGFKSPDDKKSFGPSLTVFVDPATDGSWDNWATKEDSCESCMICTARCWPGKRASMWWNSWRAGPSCFFSPVCISGGHGPSSPSGGSFFPACVRRDVRSGGTCMPCRRSGWAASTLFLLSTGLLWSRVSGQWYRALSATLGQGTPHESSAGAHRSELTGWSPPLKAGLAQRSIHWSRLLPATKGTSWAMRPPQASAGKHPLTRRVIAIAKTERVPPPYAIALPVGERGVYSVISDRNQAFNRTYLHLDQNSGRVLADVRFKEFGYLAQFGLWGIIAHEGQLFGLANQS